MSEPVLVALWPDGYWCEADELSQHSHRSDDYRLVEVTEWDDEGEPMFPGGLT